MNSPRTQFDPIRDAHITTLFLDRNEDGTYQDVDSCLMHSAKHGFYLNRRVIQIWNGYCWETATDEEAESSLREHRRCLKTTRPLKVHEVIRLIVENSVPEEENALSIAIAALDAAGIR